MNLEFCQTTIKWSMHYYGKKNKIKYPVINTKIKLNIHRN